MLWFGSRKKDRKLQEKLDELIPPSQSGELSGSFKKDLEYLKEVFRDIDPIEFRELRAGKEGIEICLIFCEGLVDSTVIDNHLIRPLSETEAMPEGKTMPDALLKKVLEVSSAKKSKKIGEIIQGVNYGGTVVLVSGAGEALIFDTKCFPMRSVSEPEGEKVLSGPHEGFTEVMLTNLSMVRRKLRTDKLKMRYYTLGTHTNTSLCVSYIEGIVKPDILEELYSRLERIDVDGILDANYINELIRDDPWSPFRSMGYTERPDVVSSKLLEGRIALFVDGTPVVLTLPYLFVENFQSNEDYYLSFYYTSFCRMLRILGFFLSVMVPAIYIAIVAYHQEMLPAPLLISIATERQSVPLPASVESIIMLVVFEILRETALRMQTKVGQALSIVGALVVGQAAVEAELVAAPMIIIVAMTGITSLMVPKMNSSVLVLRFGVLLLASCLGFLGVTVGFAFFLAHVLSLRSFGVWQLTSDRGLRYQDVKDTVIRAPWYQMILRPERLTRNVTRQKTGKGERP